MTQAFGTICPIFKRKCVQLLNQKLNFKFKYTYKKNKHKHRITLFCQEKSFFEYIWKKVENSIFEFFRL